MKKTFVALISILIWLSAVSAVEISPGWTYGLDLGIARGDNFGSKENFAPLARGYLQLEIFKSLYFRTGLGYLPLHASKQGTSHTFLGDNRVIFSPFYEKKIAPFIYAGAGASLRLGDSNADVIPQFPMGLGTKINLKRGTALEITTGYSITNSDMLDGVPNEPGHSLIAGKTQDGYFFLTAGLAFSNPGPEPQKQVVVEKQAPPLAPPPPPKPVVEKQAPPPPPPPPAPPVEKPVVVEKPKPVDPKTIDSDGDGLSDYDEINVYKTDPNKADTDGDGLSDYDEVMKYKTDPLKVDTDGDKLSDYDEVMKYKTDPLKVDTDGDKLSDYDEVMTYKTDPLKVDTDGDKLSDYDEVMTYKTDPLKVDTDGDKLSDYDEVMTYKTDPLKVDTDGDGLSDYDEVMTYKSNPLKVDSDDDGLSDYDEVTKYNTNPMDPDTDKGGKKDGEEVAEGKNPLDPKDDVMDLTVGASFSLEGIMFETAKSTILPQSIPILEQAYTALAANPEVKILIVGHTDNVGSAASNLSLSKNRAESVKNWLVNRGIAASRIRTDGKGLTQPRATNDTVEGRALNRRIEFVVE